MKQLVLNRKKNSNPENLPMNTSAKQCLTIYKEIITHKYIHTYVPYIQTYNMYRTTLGVRVQPPNGGYLYYWYGIQSQWPAATLLYILFSP